MRNNRGQSLIEFVLILPLVLITVMYIVDASKIIIQKNDIENDMNIVTNLYSSQNYEELNNYISQNNLEINYIKEDSLTTIIIKKKTTFTMPLLKNILGSNIETKRTIYDDATQENQQ